MKLLSGYVTDFIKNLLHQQLTYQQFKDYLSDNLLCLNEKDREYLIDFYLNHYFPLFSSLLFEFEEELFKGELLLKEEGKIIYIKLLKYSHLSFVHQIHKRINNILIDNNCNVSDVYWNDDSFLFSITPKFYSYTISD